MSSRNWDSSRLPHHLLDGLVSITILAVFRVNTKRYVIFRAESAALLRSARVVLHAMQPRQDRRVFAASHAHRRDAPSAARNSPAACTTAERHLADLPAVAVQLLAFLSLQLLRRRRPSGSVFASDLLLSAVPTGLFLPTPCRYPFGRAGSGERKTPGFPGFSWSGRCCPPILGNLGQATSFCVVQGHGRLLRSGSLFRLHQAPPDRPQELCRGRESAAQIKALADRILPEGEQDGEEQCSCLHQRVCAYPIRMPRKPGSRSACLLIIGGWQGLGLAPVPSPRALCHSWRWSHRT